MVKPLPYGSVLSMGSLRIDGEILLEEILHLKIGRAKLYDA